MTLTRSPKKTAFLILLLIAALVAIPVTRIPTVIILALLLLITLHELGHLLAARSVKVGASEFAVGFGPKLLEKRSKTMVWSLRSIPLGGFVRVKGMESNEPGEAGVDEVPGKSYSEVSTKAQVWISFAGPFANLITAAVLVFGGFFFLGVPYLDGSSQTVKVIEGSPAAAAGLGGEIEILTVNGQPVSDWESISQQVSQAVDSEGEVSLTIARESGPTEELTIGTGGAETIGITPTLGYDRGSLAGSWSSTVHTSGVFIEGIGVAAKSAGTAITQIPAHFAGTSEEPEKRFISPVGMSSIAKQVESSAGSLGLVILVAQFSVYLALFNLLPLPPLDGGHIVVSLINRVGRFFKEGWKIPERVLNGVAVSVGLLVLLLGVTTILLDIIRPISQI